MVKKKLSPPTWDEQNQRWKKVAYCNNMAKTFYSKKRGVTSAEKEIAYQINEWKEKVQSLSPCDGMAPMTKIKDVYPKYIEDLQERTSKGHWEPLSKRYNNYILPIIGNAQIIELKDSVLQKVINRAYKDHHLAAKTLQNIRADMTSLVKFCRMAELTAYAPKDISIPKGAGKKEKTILQPNEIKILLSVDTTLDHTKKVFERFIHAYRLQVLLALRPGEVGGLKKSDRNGDVVHIQRSINFYRETTSGKNENSNRYIALPKIARECWDKQAVLVDGDDLFPDYNSQTYRKRLKHYCISNGITPVSPYELRHTAFSIMQALPEGLVKAIGGHSASMNTFGVYGHRVEGNDQIISSMLDARYSDLLGDKQNQCQNNVNTKDE